MQNLIHVSHLTLIGLEPRKVISLTPLALVGAEIRMTFFHV